MDLSIQKLNKAFNQKILFRDLTFDIKSGSHFAITGSNGSGKSTLLKIISGGALPTSGKISYSLEGNLLSEEKIYNHVHFVAPYNTVIEELTMRELFALHQRLGLLRKFNSYTQWYNLLSYPYNGDQQIKMFSSGMKQRLKLGLALLDDRHLLLLDEPGSNLDVQGKEWFLSMLKQLDASQTVIIATNDPQEISYCSDRIELNNSTN